MKCKYNRCGWCYAPIKVETNSVGAQCLKPIECPKLARQQCSEHPDAPHGFNRSASHAEGRYVCDCEGWIPDDEEITVSDFTQQQVIDYLLAENGTFSQRKSFRMAANLIEQQQADIDALKQELELYRAVAERFNQGDNNG